MAIEKSDSKAKSYDLHNWACFAYLKQVRMPNFNWKQILKLNKERDKEAIDCLAALAQINQNSKYNANLEYALIYKQLNLLFEKHISPFIDYTRNQELHLKKQADSLARNEKSYISYDSDSDEKKHLTVYEDYMPAVNENDVATQLREVATTITQLDDFVYSLYLNDNNHLDNNYEEIKDLIQEHNPSSHNIEEVIEEELDDTLTSVKDTLSPSQVGSSPGRLAAIVSDDFKPSYDTSIKSVIHWNEANGPILIRTGTPAQKDEGQYRVEPLYRQFLKAQARAQKNPNKITHVTINLLGRDRPNNLEGKFEKSLTQALIDEEKKNPNLAVITLPADKGFMDKKHINNTVPSLNVGEVKKQFLAIAKEEPGLIKPKIKDFHISPEIRALLFQDESKLEELITKSFLTLGINPNKEGVISKAQRQAIWFHFIKYELTNHIISTLGPNTFNIDCKDGIDRGAAHRAYYILMNNIKNCYPMSRDDFQELLHAAAAGVKGRGMNFHHNLVWNAVDAYINANYVAIFRNEDKNWMIAWRDLFCPHSRIEDLFETRLWDIKNELEAASISINPEKEERMKQGLELINRIEAVKETSGQRLLLEAAIRIKELALNPTKEVATRCEELAEELKVEYPTLDIIAGYIKEFVGMVLKSLSPSGSAMENYMQDTIEKGKATRERGENAEARNQLRDEMIEFKESYTKIKNEQEQETKPNNQPQII